MCFKKDVINSEIKNLQERLDMLKSIKRGDFNPTWSDYYGLRDRMKGSSCIGVYRIVYKPTMETMSIGQGNVTIRRSRHRAVFENKGKPIIHKNGTSDSITARKMYEFDKKLENWLFTFTNIGDKFLSELYERYLQFKEKPEFNLLGMAGK